MEQIERIKQMEHRLDRASQAVMLSEDAVWNLLEDVRDVKERMKMIIENIQNSD